MLVFPKNCEELDASKPIGCSSLRRKLQLQEIFPDVKVKSIRGNLQTRLEKLDSGEYSALVLAAAGLKRLGLEKESAAILTQRRSSRQQARESLRYRAKKDWTMSI